MNEIVAKLKKRKTELGLSNQELSNLSGVPYGTVCRVMSKMDGSPNLLTLKDLAGALGVSLDDMIHPESVPGTTGQAAEAVPVPEPNSASEKKNDDAVLAAMVHSYEALLDERQRMLDMKDQALNSKDKWLTRLFITCCVLVGVIIAVLIFDLLNPAVGFFRR